VRFDAATVIAAIDFQKQVETNIRRARRRIELRSCFEVVRQ
jgi:hypothetical protein